MALHFRELVGDGSFRMKESGETVDGKLPPAPVWAWGASKKDQTRMFARSLVFSCLGTLKKGCFAAKEPQGRVNWRFLAQSLAFPNLTGPARLLFWKRKLWPWAAFPSTFFGEEPPPPKWVVKNKKPPKFGVRFFFF